MNSASITGCVFHAPEDSPSGLWRTLGKRVGCKPSGVRIPHPPPPIRDRQVPDFFMPYLLPLPRPSPLPDFCPPLAPTYTPHSLPRAQPAPSPLSPGPGFTPGPAFSRRRRPTHSLPPPIANTLRNSPAATFKAEPSSVAYPLAAD